MNEQGTGTAPAPAVHAARVLVQALAALGVREVVLAPGSRSAPLAYAVADAARVQDRDPHAPRLTLHVRVDERSAAFLALGIAKAAAAEGQARAVAVVTTSGTAVANLHPAVLEAHHSGLPLLLLTADRPHELRGTGANQTTEQVGLLEPVRATFDVPAPTARPGEDRDLRHTASRAVALALGARTGAPGPVHLNLAYRDPLVPGGEPWPPASRVGLVEVARRGAAAADPETDAVGAGGHPVRSRARLTPAEGPAPADGVRTVVVAGDGAGAVARRVAEANDWPLLAEPSSGACGGPRQVTAYRHVLGTALGEAVERVVVLGRPTLDRQVQALLGRADVESLVVAPAGEHWPDPTRSADQVLTEVPPRLLRGNLGAGTRLGDLDWAEAWDRAGAAAALAVRDVLAARDDLSGPLVAHVVAAACGPGDTLVVGSSNPVRDLALVAAWDEPPTVLANRGLAGIDGTISTAAGVALGLGRPVRALIGDLTFLHEVGGLVVGPLEARPDLTVVVANDDGGSIFATLEHGQVGTSDVVERVFGTPHGADLGALCAGADVPHVRASDAAALAAALHEPPSGLRVVEAVVDRAGRRALHLELGRAVVDAVTGTLDAAGARLPGSSQAGSRRSPGW